ncbi:MAG: hypothetical protein HY716_13670 [Planctomycetes bacterium]|nr:hypothetical protein [Planctomycetota bacterium]
MTELEEIRAKYDAGQLDYLKTDLERFIAVHATEIEHYKRQQLDQGSNAASDETAIKFFIIRYRSINPAQEIIDQVAEIEREKWIRGVESGCAPDANAVALDWARNHSAGWRAHRVTSIIYVFEREKERYLRLLRQCAGDPS